jgi:hypothetical protein
MSKARLIVACLAVFAFSGIAASSAFASWEVEGETFVSGETRELLPTALVLAHGQLLVPLAGTTIECLGQQLAINKGKIIAPEGLLVESVVFHECTTQNTGNCSVTSEISTVPIHGLVHLDGSLNIIILLLPETKATFATIAFSGETCALLGTQPVTEKAAGGVHLLIHHGQVFKLLHLVLAFSLPGALKVGSDEASLEGLDFDIALQSHKLFRFL